MRGTVARLAEAALQVATSSPQLAGAVARLVSAVAGMATDVRKRKLSATPPEAGYDLPGDHAAWRAEVALAWHGALVDTRDTPTSQRSDASDAAAALLDTLVPVLTPQWYSEALQGATQAKDWETVLALANALPTVCTVEPPALVIVNEKGLTLQQQLVAAAAECAAAVVSGVATPSLLHRVAASVTAAACGGAQRLATGRPERELYGARRTFSQPDAGIPPIDARAYAHALLPSCSGVSELMFAQAVEQAYSLSEDAITMAHPRDPGQALPAACALRAPLWSLITYQHARKLKAWERPSHLQLALFGSIAALPKPAASTASGASALGTRVAAVLRYLHRLVAPDSARPVPLPLLLHAVMLPMTVSDDCGLADNPDAAVTIVSTLLLAGEGLLLPHNTAAIRVLLAHIVASCGGSEGVQAPAALVTRMVAIARRVSPSTTLARVEASAHIVAMLAAGCDALYRGAGSAPAMIQGARDGSPTPPLLCTSVDAVSAALSVVAELMDRSAVPADAFGRDAAAPTSRQWHVTEVLATSVAGLWSLQRQAMEAAMAAPTSNLCQVVKYTMAVVAAWSTIRLKVAVQGHTRADSNAMWYSTVAV